MKRALRVRWTRLLITTAVVLATLGPAPVARAISLFWVNAAGGSAGLAANWNPAQVPTAQDIVTYSSVGTLNIFIPSSIDSVAWVTMTSGNAILTIEGTHTSPRGADIQAPGATARIRVASGTFISDTLLRLGGGSSSRGVLEVDSPASSVIAKRNFVPGAAGRGYVAVTGGGALEVGNFIEAGQALTARCTLLVSGVSVSPAQPSRLDVTSPSSTTKIGTLGDALFDIRDGAEMTCAGVLQIGVGSTADGTLRVGSATADRSRVRVQGLTSLSGPGSGTGGIGLMEVQSGGSVELASQIRIGPTSGAGTGKLRIQQGGEVIAGAGLLLRPLTGGSFEHQGGLLRVTDGALSLGGILPLSLSSATGTPELWLSNGLTTSLSAAVPTQPALTVGGSGSGRLRVSEASSRVYIVSGGVLVARGPGSTGEIRADSLGQIETTGSVTLADSGAALVQVTAGGRVTAGSIEVGASGAGAGRIEVSGSGSLLTVSGQSFLGGNSLTAGGAGVLRVRDGGALAGAGRMVIWGAGDTLAVGAGGSVNALSKVEVGGVLAMEGGTMTTGAIQPVELTGVGVIAGHGKLRSRVLGLGSTATVRVSPGTAGSQRLVIGDSIRTDGYAVAGLTQVDADTITVLDLDGAELANTSLLGGVLELPRGGRITAGSQLSGYGTVTGNVTLEGSIQASGMDQGLKFAGKLTSLGKFIAGGRVRILPTGRFSGFGTSDVNLTNDGQIDMGPAPRKLNLTRQFIQTSTGTLNIRLGSQAGGLQDTLVTPMPAMLSGTLALSALPGDAPAVGDTFVVLQRGGSVSTFANVTWNGPPGTDVQVSYPSNTVRVVIVSAILDVPPATEGVRVLRLAATGVPHRSALALDLPGAAEVTLTLFDVAGRAVAPLHAGRLDAGSHRFGLEGRGLASGVYFARASIVSPEGTRVLTTRVVTTRD